MLEPTARRLEQLRHAIHRDPIDALLVSSEVNVQYLTGFSGDATILVVAKDGRVLLISDGRYATQLAEECPGIEVHIRPVGQLLFDAVGEVVARFGAGRMGFEPSKLTVAQHATIRDLAGTVELVGVSGRVEGLRVVKDSAELDAIRRSIAVAERAFEALRGEVHPDRTEKDLADALEAHLRRLGATEAAFRPIVAAGPRAALPHARPTDRARVGDSDILLVDWGATVGGYKSDLTRVMVTGKVTPRLEKVHQAVLAARDRAIEMLRPGVKAGEVDASARSLIEEAGFGPFFNHGLGHGFGLEIHESPFFRQDNPVTLRAGMVVTIEPGIYLPDWGGVRIEDDVLITPEGAEVLSSLPRSIGEMTLG